MDYENYQVDSESVIDFEDIKNYVKKDTVYILFKNANRNNALCLERIVITGIREQENPFNETDCKLIASYYSFDDDQRHEIDLGLIGEHYVFLKTEPGKQYVTFSAKFLVPKGEWCEGCKYCSDKKVFVDECLRYHNGSCFFHLTYLDFDRTIGKMKKCEACKRATL